MIKGIGVDIVEIDRVRRALDRYEKLATRLFTAREQEYCSRKICSHRHFALRFAAKEAVLKSMGIGLRGVKWTDIEISHDRLGKPLVSLKGKAAEQAEKSGIDDILISLSISRDNAVASAVAMGGQGDRGIA